MQLHENYIFEAEKIRQNNNVIFHKNLNEKTTQSLIHCYLKIMDDDIRPNERNLIKPELNGALAQLQRKFSKNK